MIRNKKKKMVDLIDIFLNQFIAGIEPNEFKKILNSEHGILETVKAQNTMILKMKKIADTESKLYDFYKTKCGLKIGCVKDYYYKIDAQEECSKEEKNVGINTTKCYTCQKNLLYPYLSEENDIFNCLECHKTAFELYERNILKLKSQKEQ